MPTHYAHRVRPENDQGLHYSGFPLCNSLQPSTDQLLAHSVPPKIVKTQGESLKMG
jgi:hypothetical protein